MVLNRKLQCIDRLLHLYTIKDIEKSAPDKVSTDRRVLLDMLK